MREAVLLVSFIVIYNLHKIAMQINWWNGYLHGFLKYMFFQVLILYFFFNTNTNLSLVTTWDLKLHKTDKYRGQKNTFWFFFLNLSFVTSTLLYFIKEKNERENTQKFYHGQIKVMGWNLLQGKFHQLNVHMRQSSNMKDMIIFSATLCLQNSIQKSCPCVLNRKKFS